MSITTISGLIAVLFYMASLYYQSTRSTGKSSNHSHPVDRRIFYFGLVAVIAHALSAYGVIRTEAGYYFGIVHISTVIFAAVSLLVLLRSLQKPLGNLILVLFPAAILSILLSLTVASDYQPQQTGAGIVSHILLSILAYSFFTIAALQAAFLAFQNYQLRHRHAASAIRHFPPLQDMESFLFELLWTGQILLTLGIIAGFVFVEDMWTQGLPHKTFFSLLAWLVFSILLWGRHRLGWRGNTAIRGTLIGFLFLILGFYGSKIVLEYIL
jgi:ABC-type uncharacterized transport system permease subunit